MHLVEQDPAVGDGAVGVGGEVGAADVVDDGLEPPLVGDEMVVFAEVGLGGQRVGVLQAGHARRLRELVVVDEVVQHHVHRRRRPVRLAARTYGAPCMHQIKIKHAAPIDNSIWFLYSFNLKLNKIRV